MHKSYDRITGCNLNLEVTESRALDQNGEDRTAFRVEMSRLGRAIARPS